MVEEKDNQKSEKSLFEWEAPEFAVYKRKSGWYITGTIVFLGLLVVILILQEWVLAAVVFMLGVIVAQYSFLKPKTLVYKITSQGLRAGERFYKYEDFKTFWISVEAQTLSFDRKRFWAIDLVVPLPKAKSGEISKLLEEYLKEEKEKTDSWISRLGRILKF